MRLAHKCSSALDILHILYPDGRSDLENLDVNGDVCDVLVCFNVAQHGDLC